ncbi:Signal peptidase I [Tumebacillus sp. BK434]|uniref:signal peptidase I n=1 Tax=Tumebacillus sp. BK434 TaxID=2512169 RepID=UPI00104F3DF5|nr:signal peptidase I [Tumebacillus sp. BK434]TCP52734.1 Signal peptidase I [Tumebacillus sp. BK434]
MKKAMNITGKIISGFLIVVLCCNLYFVLSSKITGGEPKVFGHTLMKVLSGSMSPVFETGDLIAVKPGDLQTKYNVGDVITFRSTENASVIITHRILEVKTEDSFPVYVTKGDANAAADPDPVRQAQVIGIYANFHIPLLGQFFDWVTSKLGLAIMLIIPGLLLIAGPIVALVRELMKKEPEQKLESQVAAAVETEAERTTSNA